MTDPIRVETTTASGVAEQPRLAAGPCAVVIFGISGDLAHRKLVPALYRLMADGDVPAQFAVVGFGRSPADAAVLRAGLHDAVGHALGEHFDTAVWERFAAGLEHVVGDYDDPQAYRSLGRVLEQIDERRGTQGNRLFYVATPPSGFPIILRRLAEAGLVRGPTEEAFSRVVIEKPFGRDLESARELNALVTDVLDESQAYRIDHYLGKETVQNILVFRSGNAIFEPLWNRKYVDHVQITAAESLGVEGRGRYYERSGVVRDMVQNHLLQVLALCTMEMPISFEADEVRNQRVQLFRSLRPLDPAAGPRDLVFGQYAGYRTEPHVEPASITPTYVGLKVMIDSWRWQGVPFYLRTGKKLARRVTEVAIQFQSIPLCLFGRDDVCQRIEPNVLLLRLQPDEGISLRFASKVPGDELEVASVEMDFCYARAFERPSPDAYERLLLDAIRGDATLFARRDEVEQAWRFVAPLLDAAERGTPASYQPGSEGPAEARELVGSDGNTWRRIGS